MAHTKGNWYTVVRPSERKIHIGADKSHYIAEILSYDIDFSEAEANAKLIAAAPKMLNALEHINNISEADGIDGCTWGDTEFDSISVAYGYNQCLEHLQEIAKTAIERI